MTSLLISITRKIFSSHRQHRPLAGVVVPVAEPVLHLLLLERPRHRLPKRGDRLLVRQAQGLGGQCQRRGQGLQHYSGKFKYANEDIFSRLEGAERTARRQVYINLRII